MDTGAKRQAARPVVNYSTLATRGGPPSPEHGPQWASRGPSAAQPPRPAKRRQSGKAAQQAQVQPTQHVVHNHFTVVQSQPGGCAEAGSSMEALARAVAQPSASRWHHRSRATKTRDDAAAAALAILQGPAAETPLALGDSSVAAGQHSTAMVPYSFPSDAAPTPPAAAEHDVSPSVALALAFAARAHAKGSCSQEVPCRKPR